MNNKGKQALVRLGKIVAAGAVAAVAAWVVGPNAADVVGAQNAVLFGAILTPILSAVEKFLSGPTEKV